MTKRYFGLILVLLSFAKSCWSIRPTSSIPSVVLLDQREESQTKIGQLDDFDPSIRETSIFCVRGGGKKFSDLSIRATSAVVVLLGLFLLLKNTGNVGVIVLILASQVGMFDEVMNVSSVSDPTKWLAFFSHLLFWDGKHLFADDKVNSINMAAFGLTALHIVALVLVQNRSSTEFSKSLQSFCQSQTAAGLILGASSALLGTLHAFTAMWIAFPGLLVIVNDTMAYVCGVIFGQHPLLPNISPKKTWEGFIGAAVFTLALAKPVWMLLLLGNNNNGGGNIRDNDIYAIALYVSLVAPFGGFLASTVKRTFGAKDFGAVMPGHGGLVDRLDCQLLTAPFVYLYLQMK
mmetsp:Transcript_7378/g.11216  ORF Transcript_7378/g.11216 Transcript_7378/m.11216 type:complete len:347 (+) Transcript_7378:146-1186(+)|eukprot:CAMPEP_0178907894 /NCGR_PEP_ID=MMETSP0786-20121207/7621_1 /TAXON_ID=186022 /ORGANISM="Thalassionema frauenfeldii, Strain CCMP 1798" /LENGTH=346 /DNA_ID=CAMNT_0020579737 /DNA_START=55 /DNA_END=1095 /DNA_ORIENTATION=-